MGYKQYYVYLLTNPRKTVLYTGVTNSLERRVWQHKNKAIEGFTKTHNCEWLFHFETFGEIDQAIAREKQIKGWTRAKKNVLVTAHNPEWNDLAADWYRQETSGSFAALRPSGAPPAQDDTRHASQPREKK